MYDNAMGPLTRVGMVAVACISSIALVSGCGDDEKSSDTKAGEAVAATAPDKAIVASIPSWDQLEKAQPAAGTYVGDAGPKRNPSVGFVVQGDKVVVYVCNGKDFADWFGGEVKDGRFNLRSKKGTRVEGEVSDSTVSGTLTLPGGSPLDYTAKPAVEGKTGVGVGAGEAGLKRRWIATSYALRGVDDGTGTVRNGVAVTEATGSTGSGGTTTGGAGQPAPVACKDYVTAGCHTDCGRLIRERSNLRRQRPQTVEIKKQIEAYDNQFTAPDGGCLVLGGTEPNTLP